MKPVIFDGMKCIELAQAFLDIILCNSKNIPLIHNRFDKKPEDLK